MMRVCVVVLNYNSGKYIESCLTSLVRLDYAECEILVVDNASTDDSLTQINKKYPKIKTIRSDNNLGYAGGNNLGLQYAMDHSFDAAWIVNPDIVVAKNALTKLVSVLEKDAQVGVVGSKVYFQKGFEFHKDKYASRDLGKVLWFAGGKMDWQNVYAVHIGMDEVDQGQYDLPMPVDLLTGASMLIRTSVLQKSGLIDEKYFLYYEENDLCQRILKVGYKLYYCPESVVSHANAQSTGIGSPLQDYYTTRNRLLFGMRWAPLRSKIALIRESITFILTGRPWQKRGAMDYYLGKFGKGSYAD